MTPFLKTGALLLAAMLSLPAAAQPVNIGYINLARIESESAFANRASELLKQEFEPRGKQIQAFQKQIEAERERLKKLPQAEAQVKGREVSDMMRKSDQMLARFTEEYEARKNELRGRMIEELNVAIKAVAEAGKYDLILQEAAFVRPVVDVTPQVLKEMAKRAPALK
jgi:outer membrane protein